MKRSGQAMPPPARGVWIALVLALVTPSRAAVANQVDASSSLSGYPPSGAIDAERFAALPGTAWKGNVNASAWWWRIEFAQARKVGAILQVHGDHPFVFRNAPQSYVWQSSDDGILWEDLRETATPRERRLFRVHRLARPRVVRRLRLLIDAVEGECPTLREVEFYANPQTRIRFNDWIVVVNTTDNPGLPGHGQEFIPLARSCKGWESLQAQQVWLASFDPEFLAVRESHCGQIEWPPRGWVLIASGGAGALTKTQCLRVQGRCIYAAQFHIELEGTARSSQTIMGNFLSLARARRGDKPPGEPVPAP